MEKYLLVQSRHPFESTHSDQFFSMVEGICERSNDVVVYFLQNGVLPTQKGSVHNGRITELLGEKIRILADKFSLEEHSIGNIMEGVQESDRNKLVQLLVEPGRKAIWP